VCYMFHTKVFVWAAVFAGKKCELVVVKFYGTRYQNVSFSFINVGSCFHCRCSFFLAKYNASRAI
jgi:hypothetical protein